MISAATLGIIAGVLAFLSAALYIRAILLRTTKPDRVTWWILSVLNGMIVASSYSLGAWDTLWTPVAYCITFAMMGILSLSHGEGSYRLTVLQKGCVVGALFAASLWYVSGDALIALILSVVIDCLALVPTIYKSYVRPWHEDTVAWALSTLASVFAVAAVDVWVISIALYPLYLLASNGLILVLLIWPRSA